MKRFRILTPILVALLVALPALAQPNPEPIAKMNASATGLSFTPKAGFASVALSVSGPNGIVYTYSFVNGERIYFDGLSPRGEQLQDGSYNFELVGMPEARERGTGATMARQTQSGSFAIVGGQIVSGGAEEAPLLKDQQILDDLIVDGSICVGQDCVNGESFGFDTLRLKENNLRIKAQDTSNTASFPSTDWQITFNETSNGGQNKFSIDDIDGGRTPFTIEASAPSHSLYVDSGGRIGLGKSTPVVELHVVDGDTPTIRLEQDGSSGFTAQTFDLAANEANFFVRDATNGSRLIFKIKPNAPTSSIFVENTTGDIGFQTESPTNSLHVRRTDGTASIKVENLGSGNLGVDLLSLESDGPARLAINNTLASSWQLNSASDGLRISDVDVSNNTEFRLDGDGNLIISGNLRTNLETTCANMANCFPDYVFEDGYDLMPLSDVKAHIEQQGHLPNVPPAAEVMAQGLDMTTMQLKLVEKVEELTLYTIAQHETIQALQARLDALEGKTTEQ